MTALQHELILGSPGCGKSNELREKIKKVHQEQPTDLIVLMDLFGEFASEEFEIPEVRRIALGQGSVYNPLEGVNRNSDPSAVAEKSEFMCTFLSFLIGKKESLTAYDLAVVHRCVAALLDKEEHDFKPTLADMCTVLAKDGSPEANKLILVLEPYISGVYAHMFGGKTTVNIQPEDSMVILQGPSYALYTPVAFLYLEMIKNYAKSNKNGTIHLFINDADHLFGEEIFADFVKRASDLNIAITMTAQSFQCITESRPGLSAVDHIRNMTLFSMCGTDIKALQAQIGLPDNLCGVITNQKPGIGLFYDGQTFVPFNRRQ